MAKNLEIVLNSAGVQELLKSPEIIGVLEASAKQMTQMTGVTYKADTRLGARRAITRVTTNKRSGKGIRSSIRTMKQDTRKARKQEK